MEASVEVFWHHRNAVQFLNKSRKRDTLWQRCQRAVSNTKTLFLLYDDTIECKLNWKISSFWNIDWLFNFAISMILIFLYSLLFSRSDNVFDIRNTIFVPVTLDYCTCLSLLQRPHGTAYANQRRSNSNTHFIAFV